MINLLPESEKEIILQEGNWRLILVLGTLFLLFLMTLSLIFLSININLASELNEEKILAGAEEERLKTAEMQDLEERINTLNGNLTRLNSFYGGQSDLTGILEKISETLPPGVYLKNFSYQKSSSQVTLSGFSLTREALVELKANIKKEKDFKDLDFPLSNFLVKPQNIDFYLTFKLPK